MIALDALLQAFGWNSALVPSDDDGDVSEEGLLCPICRAPLNLREMIASSKTPGKPEDGSAPGTPCCRSCAHQLADVLQPSSAASTRESGTDNVAAAHVRPSLPSFMRWRVEALRTGMLLDRKIAD